MDNLVEIKNVIEILREVVDNPDKYVILEKDAMCGTASQAAFDQPHEYQRVSASLVFLDKSRIPQPPTPSVVTK